MNRQDLLLLLVTFASVATAITLALSGKHWDAQRDKQRARRLAEHQMNARLLRLDI